MKSKFLSKAFRAAKWRINGRAYHLQPMDTYADRFGIKQEILLEKRTVSGSEPKFFGGIDSVDLTLYRGAQLAPRVTLTQFENVTAIGRSELVLHGSNALYPSPFDPALYSFMLEGEKRARVNLKRGRIKMLFRSRSIKLDTAISLLGQCNGNYAHWVLEVLTRLALVNSRPELRGLPLLIDTPIHEKMLDALDLLNASGREVIPVRDAERVKLKRLFSITSPSFTPPETRQFFNTGIIAPPERDQFQFSPDAFDVLRNLAVSECSQYVAPKPMETRYLTHSSRATDPRLVFLQRRPGTTGNGRHVANEAVVQGELRKQKFRVIDTFSLSFEEQVMALQGSEIVVSAVGAACANLIFCKPGLSVIMLSPRYPNATWFYWVNLMIAAGHKLYFVLGPQVASSSGTIYHKDFKISLKLLNEAVEAAKSERLDNDYEPSHADHSNFDCSSFDHVRTYFDSDKGK
ncbi:glycosyltransferase family 61 protein [Agrobacterium cavarae]|uniref:glycosyltransferase family 61 protein n=1 Tax=Agrobacterium cavarae TaxID=2528239 RepID=UPI003FD547A0